MNRLVLMLLLFVTVLAAMIAGPSLIGEKGYILIAMGSVTIETSVVAAGVFLFFAIIGFLLLEWLFKFLLSRFSGNQNWFGGFGKRRADKAYFKGITAYFEGDLSRAQKWLSKTRNYDFDGVNLLAAGQVAAEQGDYESALTFWQQAVDESKADYAAKVCIANVHLRDNAPEKTLLIIDSLSEDEQARPTIVKLWLQSLAKLGRWNEIQRKLNNWRKTLGDDYNLWAQRAAQGEFAEIASKSGANQLTQHWHQLPRNSRRDPAKQAAYIQQLLDQGMHQDAQKHLVEWQKTGIQPMLAPLLKQLRLANPTPAIKLIEHWLKSDENNVELLTILGHLAFNSGNDILAEKALQKAVKLEPTQEQLRMLAHISERKQDNVRALALYKQSIE